MVERKLVVILGTTSSGKTDLAIKLARRFKGEVVSADSRQVYRGLNLGTGKVTKKEMRGVPHHLLDVASPRQRFDVVRYRSLAHKAIHQIQDKDKLPILCGGTGFYIQAVIDNPSLPQVKPDWRLRQKLTRKSLSELARLLKKLDPRRAKQIDLRNPRRVIRALEILLKSKTPVPPLRKKPLPYPVLIIGLRVEAKTLNKKIRERLRQRLSKGLVAEVYRLRQNGLSWSKLESFGLEYRWVSRYLQEQITKTALVAGLAKAIEDYAQRQMVWFKRDKRIVWLPQQGLLPKATALVKKFLSP